MKNWILALGATTALGAAGGAAAYDGGPRGEYGRGYGSGAYVGLSLGQLRYSEDGLDTITPADGVLTIGASLSPNLSIEGRIGAGFARADTNGYGVDLDSFFAGYLKGSLPLSPGFSLYGLGGIAGVDLKRDFGIGETHDTSLSYGVGMDFDLYGGTRLNVEWTRLASGNDLGFDYHVDQASIGVAWRF
ncbi:MAG TPA: porin family protein [Steroidobacteraceae bacterium]|nr:porin family protein [Steroidobacteraceae bacterium]